MSDVIEQIRRLSTADVDCCDRDEIATIVAISGRVRSWLDALDLRCTRRTRALAQEGRAESPESMHARHGNRSSKESAVVTDREIVSAAMPSLEDTLAAGEISAGHLDAIANAARRLPVELRIEFSSHEDELREHATHDTVDAFARRCRDLARRLITDADTGDADELDRQRAASNVRSWTAKDTGMYHLHAELDPLRAETVVQAFNRAIAARRQVDGNARTPWDQIRVDAFVEAMCGGLIVDDVPSVDDLTDALAGAVEQAVRRSARTSDRGSTNSTNGVVVPTASLFHRRGQPRPVV